MWLSLCHGNNSPVEINVLSAQILVSKCQHPQKGTRTYVTGSRVEVEEVQDDSGHLLLEKVRKYTRKCGLVKGQRSQLEGVSTERIWIILRIKGSSDSNTLLLFVV